MRRFDVQVSASPTTTPQSKIGHLAASCGCTAKYNGRPPKETAAADGAC